MLTTVKYIIMYACSAVNINKNNSPKKSIGRGGSGLFKSFRFLLHVLFPLYGNLDLLLFY